MRCWTFLALLCAGGCASASLDSSDAELGLGTAEQAIVNGQVSTVQWDSAVLVSINPGGTCTGVLIAPNLVQTARHCVAQVIEPAQYVNSYCDGRTFGALTSPANVGIFTGVDAPLKRQQKAAPAALGKKIAVPSGNRGCDTDIALILLDRDIAGAKIAAVRRTRPAAGEALLAVGYGLTEDIRLPAQRLQRSLTVTVSGPTTVQQVGALPAGVTLASAGVCSGDSGGPAYDANGNVVTVTTAIRVPQNDAGLPLCAQADLTFLTEVTSHLAVIDQALAEANAGRPVSGGSRPDAGAPGSSGRDAGAGTPGQNSDKGNSADDEDEDSGSSSRSKRNLLTQASTGGCSAAPKPSGGNPLSLGWLLAGLGALFQRRRATRRGASR